MIDPRACPEAPIMTVNILPAFAVNRGAVNRGFTVYCTK